MDWRSPRQGRGADPRVLEVLGADAVGAEHTFFAHTPGPEEVRGAHFPFHDDLPTWAMDGDADLCVTSTRKMGGGLGQASVFHPQGERVTAEVLKLREDLLGTTSPPRCCSRHSTAGAARWSSTERNC
ncbi:hypothetical protein [Amycolatopsis sp.]|uniref:hypothetical protein n=1 Tax=Amycolatopsis sp. TaxID=37632 RepID=UPI002C9EB6B2|nr:hypothetical protein [Amycolatopsis sp.]HVV09260.1 hypothetical protein [Amycolatopsis sp.]